MLDCCLEGIGTAEFRVGNDQANGPINGYGQDDEKDDTCEQTGLAKGVGLTYDSGTTAQAGQTMFRRVLDRGAHMILFAMFIKALDMELLGRALSSRSFGLKSDSARVTAGASMPVSRGAFWPALCLLSLQLSAVK